MTIIGPDFIALQVRDLERAATFYEQHVGLTRAAFSPPHAVVFDTKPIAFALRDPLPTTDLTANLSGVGAGIWLLSTDAQELHDSLAAAGVEIVAPPVDGPFGRTFTFTDPDGYSITIHDGE